MCHMANNGKHTSFPRAVKAKDSETVVLSWVIYKSRSHRDAVLKRAMADARMKMDMSKTPFDGKRMIYGGFKTFLAMQLVSSALLALRLVVRRLHSTLCGWPARRIVLA
jgi:Protein of unknown function (DUF1428)